MKASPLLILRALTRPRQSESAASSTPHVCSFYYLLLTHRRPLALFLAHARLEIAPGVCDPRFPSETRPGTRPSLHAASLALLRRNIKARCRRPRLPAHAGTLLHWPRPRTERRLSRPCVTTPDLTARLVPSLAALSPLLRFKPGRTPLAVVCSSVHRCRHIGSRPKPPKRIGTSLTIRSWARQCQTGPTRTAGATTTTLGMELPLNGAHSPCTDQIRPGLGPSLSLS